MTSRSKEKSWTRFHQAAVNGFPGVGAVTGCAKFAMLLALEIFTHLLEIAFPPQPTTNTLVTELSSTDIDIVSHIGGSIVCKLRKRYRSHKREDREECIESLCKHRGGGSVPDQPGASTSLTTVLDRGGLTHITATALTVFNDLERTFRNCFDKITTDMSPKYYQSRVVDAVTCTFYEATCESSVSDDVKENVLSDVIKLFFKIRCHSQLQKIVRTFRIKKNTARKQKPLRKVLKPKV